jgi:hypothetical protein
LPSRLALCPTDSNNIKTVNITYNGKTLSNIPVWDVGPWNIYDDYWNKSGVRNTYGYSGYGTCARGDSESYAACNFSFHNGWSSSHIINGTLTAYSSDSNPGTQVHPTKTNPKTSLHLNESEIDLSDGVWNYFDLSSFDEVTVTFNWVSE